MFDLSRVITANLVAPISLLMVYALMFASPQVRTMFVCDQGVIAPTHEIHPTMLYCGVTACSASRTVCGARRSPLTKLSLVVWYTGSAESHSGATPVRLTTKIWRSLFCNKASANTAVPTNPVPPKTTNAGGSVRGEGGILTPYQ